MGQSYSRSVGKLCAAIDILCYFGPNEGILIFKKLTQVIYGSPLIVHRSGLTPPHTVLRTTPAFKIYRVSVGPETFVYQSQNLPLATRLYLIAEKLPGVATSSLAQR